MAWKQKYDDSWIGRKFNYLTIVGFGKCHRFICKCDCGNVKEYVSINVVRGDVKSCGCYGKSHRSENAKTHGGHGTRLYSIWSGMKSRCYVTSATNYRRYGGAGVTMCDDWHYDFTKFRDWALANGYTDELTIDRIDPYGNYEPSNCRWATWEEQANNKRDGDDWDTKHKWNINGTVHSARTWCEMYGLSYPMVMYRVNVKGMEPIDALTKPKHFMYR